MIYSVVYNQWGKIVDKTETFLDVSIWREQNGDGHFETYQVPQRANQTILDVVAWVQQQADPTLSYRFACPVLTGVLHAE